MAWTLDYAKRECDRLLSIGVVHSDVALLLASWGLSSEDLEEANWYLHETKGLQKKKVSRNYKGIED